MKPTSAAIQSTRYTVLLVDDMPQTLGALAQELEADRYSVLIAASGAAALKSLDLVIPDAILLDAMMPGLDGFEVCARIKAKVELAHIPVIFMTGLSETEHVVKGFAAGGVDYVLKPVRAAEVLARLDAHVRNARAVRTAREALDIGGNGVLVLDARGRVAWRSPQAQRWLSEFFSGAPAEACAGWLAEAGEEPAGAGVRRSGPVAGRTLIARRLGEPVLGDVTWLLSVESAGDGVASRLASAALTPRETEVLSWVAKGKTNRDVGDILGMSPRTVNKHLEHVFEKLGVETRAAAAALASRESKGA